MSTAEVKSAAKAEATSLKLESVRERKLPAPVLGFDFSEDAKHFYFYAACLDGYVHEVEAESGKWVALGKHESCASSVHRIPGTKQLVSGGYDGVLQWHDLEARRTVRKVSAHKFWSWQTAVSPDGKLLASVTGQYQCGGYKSEPASETEPSVKFFDARTGELLHSLTHVPPVQSVAFSADGKIVAPGNLMGEVRIWGTATAQQLASFTTSSFTGWGDYQGPLLHRRNLRDAVHAWRRRVVGLWHGLPPRIQRRAMASSCGSVSRGRRTQRRRSPRRRTTSLGAV